ncbi:membrane protein [Streptomyces avidinii]
MTGPAATNTGRRAPDGTEPPGTARGGAPERAVRPPAPWVRTRLRATPLATLLGAALAFVAVLLSAALPRAEDRGADQALRSFLESRGPSRTSLWVTAPPRFGNQTPKDLDEVLAALVAGTGPLSGVAPNGPVHGSSADARSLANPGLASPDGVPPQLSLYHLREAEGHVRLVEGSWPGAPSPGGPIPVVLSQSAARSIGVRVGMVLESTPGWSEPLKAEVVGLYAANDEADVYWTDLACLTHACLSATPSHPPRNYWQTAGLVSPEALDRLGEWGQGNVRDFWRIPVDTGTLRADQLSDTASEIASYMAGPTASRLRGTTHRSDLEVASGLPELFDQAKTRRQAAAPLAAMGPAGVAGVAFVVFCLAAALTGDRRESELRLLLARGGSRTGIVRRLLAESAVTVLPAAALATALAVALLPTPRVAGTVFAASAATLVTLLAFPVRAAVLLSPPRAPGPRRRLVAELLVLAATAAAVYEVRSRGISPAGSGVDPLLVAAPLLLALCGGLLLARIQPALVGALARAAGRGPGLVGFLGLARAARGTGGTSRPSVLPLVALLLAVTTGGFGSTVLTAVKDVRQEVVRQAIGGDAQIAAPGGTLPASLTKAAAALPGVRSSVDVWTDDNAFLAGTKRGSTQVTVVVADPVAYAELSRAVGRGPFDPAALAGGAPGAPAPTGTSDAPIPALVSGDIAAEDISSFRLRMDAGNIQVTVAGVIDGTPARPGAKSTTVVVPAGPVTAALPKLGLPDRWYALGSFDQHRLEEIVRAADPAAAAELYRVRTSSAEAAALGSDPLQRSAERLFWASLAGAAGFAVLAVLLTLVRAAPDRAALLARLRTMGLRPRQAVLLILTESVPLALAAALGGALAAAGAVALLGPAVDLSTLVGAKVPSGIRLLARPVLVQALGLTVLVAGAVLAEAAISGRRQITTELRAGDQR